MAASNTSTLNLGGDDGMFNIPPEPKKAEQTQRTANSTENASNAGGRSDVNGNPRKPPTKYQKPSKTSPELLQKLAKSPQKCPKHISLKIPVPKIWSKIWSKTRERIDYASL